LNEFNMKINTRPTGIIRTLPSLYGDESVGARQFHRSIKLLEQEKLPAVYIALAQMPKLEVLYMYLLVDGEITVRLNIAGYEPGDARECWDKTIRQPKFWAECTGPVSRPPEPIKRRGFQGFRYTEDLW
jgi:hypothetical protein